MPKRVDELKALDIRRLNRPGLHAVGVVSGLCLSVSTTGAKSWILRTMVVGKRREIGLGGYPEVSLAHAREQAREMKQRIRDGVDPVEERRATREAQKAEKRRGITLGDAYELYLETKKLSELTNEKHRRQWRSSFDTYARPLIGDKMVHEITVQDIKSVLDPIWAEKTETASRLRGRLDTVLVWATVSGYRVGESPARWAGNLKEILASPSKLKKEVSHPAVQLADAPRWFAQLQSLQGTGSRALEFLTLTAARSAEVRGATWDEFDLVSGNWVVPAGRMKMRREHRVPLTGRTTELIRTQPRFLGSPYVFAAARGGMLSDMTLSATMRRMNETDVRKGGSGFHDQRTGRPAVPHGLRSTFSDWAGEMTSFPRHMVEMALAHLVGNEVERAYRRGDMLEKRREMMAAWETFLIATER